jgi:GntR family transcriptional repressor for pyruvate dehydrogenase complex
MKPKEIFYPADGDNIGDDVACQIQAAIVSGQIQPGQRLPSERELQGIFKTGRGVVREALRGLKQKGLIEVKKGAHGGAVVKQVEVTAASESLAILLSQHRIPLDYLVEFRESIDRTVTTLAIARGTDDEKRELWQGAMELERLLNQKEPDWEAVSELDLDLNLRLVKMTKNPMFEWVMLTIQQGFGSHDHALYEDEYYRDKVARNWMETARAIADNEPQNSLSFIGYHYVLLRRCLKEQSAKGKTPEPGAS